MDEACDLMELPWIYRKAMAFLTTLLVSTRSGGLVQRRMHWAQLSLSESTCGQPHTSPAVLQVSPELKAQN